MNVKLSNGTFDKLSTASKSYLISSLGCACTIPDFSTFIFTSTGLSLKSKHTS